MPESFQVTLVHAGSETKRKEEKDVGVATTATGTAPAGRATIAPVVAMMKPEIFVIDHLPFLVLRKLNNLKLLIVQL
jgi:hypothetical protein